MQEDNIIHTAECILRFNTTHFLKSLLTQQQLWKSNLVRTRDCRALTLYKLFAANQTFTHLIVSRCSSAHALTTIGSIIAGKQNKNKQKNNKKLASNLKSGSFLTMFAKEKRISVIQAYPLFSVDNGPVANFTFAALTFVAKLNLEQR